MTVREVMIKDVQFCGPEMNLAEATELLWNAGCGILPVVDQNFDVIGMITDRDICVGLGAAQCSPSELPVADVMTSPIHACRENDNLGTALETMQREHVRRLPVLDDGGTLVGILSIDDVLGWSGRVATLADREIVEAYRAICGRPEEGESQRDGA